MNKNRDGRASIFEDSFSFRPNRFRGKIYNSLTLGDGVGGPDRGRTDDLFHAISATSRNSLKLHDINRSKTRRNAHVFPAIGPLMDPQIAKHLVLTRLGL
jgi:hypothetical protein